MRGSKKKAEKSGQTNWVKAVFEAIQVQSKLSSRQAYCKLNTLRKCIALVLQEDVCQVEWLVWLAYGDLPTPYRVDMAREQFFSNLNSLSLSSDLFSALTLMMTNLIWAGTKFQWIKPEKSHSMTERFFWQKTGRDYCGSVKPDCQPDGAIFAGAKKTTFGNYSRKDWLKEVTEKKPL